MAKKPKLQAYPLLGNRLSEVLGAQQALDTMNSMTPEDNQQFFNYNAGQTIEKNIGVNPFHTIRKGRSIFDPTVEPVAIVDADSKKNKAFKELHNNLVKYKGRIPSADFLQRSFSHSMTADWMRFLDVMEDPFETGASFMFTENGMTYQGDELKLTSDEQMLFSDYVEKLSGEDRDISFLEKVGTTALSLVWDTPLLYMSNLAARGVMKSSHLGKALLNTTTFKGRALGQIAQQAINFNIMGLPQTAHSAMNEGIGAAAEQIFHSVWMGTLAGGLSSAGAALMSKAAVRPAVKSIFRKNPAMREELGGLGSSFGFGYISAKFAGLEDDEALAQGMAFAATHFTNPTAYKRIMAMQNTKDVKIKVNKWDGKGRPIEYEQDYFIEKPDGKLYKIDTDVFKQKGETVEISSEGLIPTKGNAKDYVYYNERPDLYLTTFAESMQILRLGEANKQLIDRWIADGSLSKAKYEKNPMVYDNLASITNTSIMGQRLGKLFGETRLPDDAKLNEGIVKFANEHEMPYGDVKRMIKTGIAEYTVDPKAYMEKLKTEIVEAEKERKAETIEPEGEKISVEDLLKPAEQYAKDVDKLMGTAVDVFAQVRERTQERERQQIIREQRQRKKEIEVEPTVEGGEAKKVEAGREEIVELLKEEYGEEGAERISVQLSGEEAKYITTAGREGKEVTPERLKEIAEAEVPLPVEPKVEPKVKLSKPKPTLKQIKAKVKKVIEGEEKGVQKTTANILTSKEIETASPEKLTLELRRMKDLDIESFNESQRQEIVRTMNEVEQMLKEHKEAEKVLQREKEKKIETEELAKPSPESEEALAESADKSRITKTKPIIEISEDVKTYNKAVKFAKLKDNEGKRFQAFAEEYGVPDIAMPIFHIADALGFELKFRIGRADRLGHWNPSDKSVNMSNRFFGSEAKEKNFGLAYPREQVISTAIHEIIHGLTLGQPGARSKYYNEIADKLEPIKEFIWNRFQADKKNVRASFGGKLPAEYQTFEKSIKYGFSPESNLAEMATVAFSRPIIADYLDRINLPDHLQTVSTKTAEVKSIWDWITFGVRQFTKEMRVKAQLPPKETDVATVLDEMSNIFAKGFGTTEAERAILGRFKAREGEIIGERVQPSEIAEVVPTTPRPGRVEIEKPIEGKTIPEPEIEPTTPTDTKRNDSMLESKPKIVGDQETQTKYKYNSVKEKPETTKLLDQAYEGEAKEIYADKIIERNESRDERDSKVNKPLSNNASRKASKVEYNQREEEVRKVLTTDLLTKDVDTWKSIVKDVFGRVGEKLERHFEHLIPPVFTATHNKVFRPFGELGEELVNGSARAKNRILFSEKLWNNAAKMKQLPEISQKIMLEAFDRYDNARYRNIAGVGKGEVIEKNMSWDEFADWAHYDGKQREVLKDYRNALDASIAKRQELDALFLTEFDTNIAKYLTEAEIKKYTETFTEIEKEERLAQLEGKDLTEQKELINEWANGDVVFKEEIALDIAGRKYKEWGSSVYYNATRPVEPNTWHINMVRPKDLTNIPEHMREELAGDERIFTYAESQTQALKIVAKLKGLGYQVQENGLYKVGDIIADKSYTNRLTEIEIRELADAGHIEYDNEVIDKLIDATKRGLNAHTIHKEYIPGMKYTSTEFNNQLHRFVNESIQGGYKNYYLRKLETDLSALRSRVNAGEEGLRTTVESAQAYINQLRQPEKTWIDNIRFWTMTSHVGLIKPAFLVMQTLQTVQTGLAEMVRNAKDIGLTTGDGFKAWNNAWTEAPKYQVAIRERLKVGTSSEEIAQRMNLDLEKLDMLEKLQWGNKITASGISEIMAISPELDYQHHTNYKRHIDKLGKVVSAAGRGIERLTRMQTALGMMEIGKAQGKKGEQLYDFIARGVDKAMGEFGKGGRAPILYGKKKGQTENQLIHGLRKSLLTYKNYSFYNFGQWQEMIRNKQFSAIWTKAIVGLGLHGLKGMPLMATFMALGDFFTDENMDYELYKLSDELDEAFGFNLGSATLRGVPNFIGMDTSDMFAEITPLATDVFGAAWGDTWEERLNNIIEGAAVGFAKDVINEANNTRLLALDVIKGNTISTEKQIEKASRILLKLSPIAVRNPLNAMTMAKDGIEVRGKVMVVREDLDALDIAYKILSFPLAKQQRAYVDYKFGPEVEYEKNKRIISEANSYIKDLRRKGELKPEALAGEIQRIIKIREEARVKAKELKREATLIKRKRELSQRIKEGE